MGHIQPLEEGVVIESTDDQFNSQWREVINTDIKPLETLGCSSVSSELGSPLYQLLFSPTPAPEVSVQLSVMKPVDQPLPGQWDCWTNQVSSDEVHVG